MFLFVGANYAQTKFNTANLRMIFDLSNTLLIGYLWLDPIFKEQRLQSDNLVEMFEIPFLQFLNSRH